MAKSTGFSMPLYQDGKSVWRQGSDTGGEIDVAVLEVQRGALPTTAVYRAFTPAHLQDSKEPVELSASLLVVGFPLGFHDALHHLPVVRHAVNASSFGAARMDVGTRDLQQDEALGLNCAWYADILLTLTEHCRAGGARRCLCRPGSLAVQRLSGVPEQRRKPLAAVFRRLLQLPLEGVWHGEGQDGDTLFDQGFGLGA